MNKKSQNQNNQSYENCPKNENCPNNTQNKTQNKNQNKNQFSNKKDSDNSYSSPEQNQF